MSPLTNRTARPQSVAASRQMPTIGQTLAGMRRYQRVPRYHLACEKPVTAILARRCSPITIVVALRGRIRRVRPLP